MSTFLSALALCNVTPKFEKPSAIVTLRSRLERSRSGCALIRSGARLHGSHPADGQSSRGYGTSGSPPMSGPSWNQSRPRTRTIWPGAQSGNMGSE